MFKVVTPHSFQLVCPKTKALHLVTFEAKNTE